MRRRPAAIAIIKRQATQLTRLVDDLLDVSRITQGRIELERETLDLSSVITQAVETVEPLLREKHHEVSITAGYESLYVSGDFARIFDLFVQSERTLDRAQGGLGIGLSVVKKLLQMHGGEIQAHSAGVGEGSTFEIKLPRVAAPSASSGGTEMQKVSTRRVFIVDDNADAADSLAELLRIEGHQAQAVHSPAAALELIDSFHPDIALLDIGLPEMDGFELVRRLRERPALVGVKFVALTGYGQIEDRRRVRESGFDDHLIKPIDLDALDRIFRSMSRGAAGGGSAQ